jgi:pimeloyl-ACP methyl ester carboxylesterase
MSIRSASAHPARASRIAAVVAAAAVAVLAACGGDDASPSASSPAVAEPSTSTTVARPTAPVDELVRVDGGRLHVRCSGAGDTTVVLIAGFEDGGDNWGAVTAPVSEDARVCSYARFGTGASDPPPTPQTFATEADDLRTLLRTIGEPGPYLLVGHSYGGAEAVTFASSFPDDVSGLVLVDASPVTWLPAMCAVPDDGSETARIFRSSCDMQSDPAGNAERLDGPAAFARLADITSLGRLPMVVTTAADHGFPASLADVWAAGQQHWASLSSAATLTVVDRTTHHIQVDRPDAVIDAIRQLLT